MASSPGKDQVSVFASSLLSSSPPFIPCRRNPKPRTSETGDLMRQSFRGYPFPPDSSRRHSVDRGSNNRVEFGDKENQNGKDYIPNVAKCPKGSKNFMSPTISAVYKINSSPRKRILSDRNQEVSRSFDKSHHEVQVRSSSVSFSDVISIIGVDKDHGEICCIDEKKQIDEKEAHDITVTGLDENLENMSNNDDSSFKTSPYVPYTCPVFEVDPVVAPYDPKKNYLSPRPQFLHYKPNPRIELHFDGCRKLDELFISQSSSSDTDLTAGESQQEEEVASQASVVAIEEATENQDKDCQERFEEVENDDDEEEHVVEERLEEETGQISKQSHFKTSKLLGWISVIGVAYLLLVSSMTFTQPDMVKYSSFYQFHIPTETIKSARESFQQLSVKLIMWAESSLVYMDKLISRLREEKGYSSVQFHNLTDILEDQRLSDTIFQTTSADINFAGLLVDDSQYWSPEIDTEEENVDRQESEESENGNEVDKESEGTVYEFDKQTEIKVATVTEVDEGEIYSESLSEEVNAGQETNGVEGEREYEQKYQMNIEEYHESETSSARSDDMEMEEAEPDTLQLDDMESAAISDYQQEDSTGEIAGNSFSVSTEDEDAEHDSNDLEEGSGFGKVVNNAGLEEILLINKKKLIVLFSTVMVLLAVAAAAFLVANKKAKPVMVLHEDGEEQTTISGTKEVNFKHVPVENLIKERLSLFNFQEEEEVDNRKREVLSFPSEMSFNFHKNKSLHSCSSNRDIVNEYESGGGGRKKSNDSSESMASSASEYSVGSVSYGSFTTYEKIRKRSGRKEKEIITPVRRSSRIRNHQHSGQ